MNVFDAVLKGISEVRSESRESKAIYLGESEYEEVVMTLGLKRSIKFNLFNLKVYEVNKKAYIRVI